MPELDLKYELTTNQFIKLQQVEFENKIADIRKDQCTDNLNIFKNTDPYIVIPDNDYINILVLANASMGGEGFKWSLNIWINDILITKNPIETKINAAGKADYNGKIKWC